MRSNVDIGARQATTQAPKSNAKWCVADNCFLPADIGSHLCLCHRGTPAKRWRCITEDMKKNQPLLALLNVFGDRWTIHGEPCLPQHLRKPAALMKFIKDLRGATGIDFPLPLEGMLPQQYLTIYKVWLITRVRARSDSIQVSEFERVEADGDKSLGRFTELVSRVKRMKEEDARPVAWVGGNENFDDEDVPF